MYRIPSKPLLGFHLLLLLGVANALAPPHPTWKDYESVHAMRRRLNITYNYQTKHLPAEYCRYLNETACQQEDERQGEFRANRRKLRADRRLANPSIGKHEILVLLGYFPENVSLITNNIVPSQEYISTLYNGPGNTTINPVGSLHDWMVYNSVSQYDATFNVQPWKALQNSAAYYAKNVSAKLTSIEVAQIFIPLLNEMDSAGFDWSPFDANGDGSLDGLVLLYAGYPAEYGNVDCAPPPAQRIWSQGVSACPGCWTSKDGKYSLGGYCVTGSFTFGAHSTNCTTPLVMGLPQHEFVEEFGLLDLYDQDTTDPYVGIAGIGSFDTLCNPYGWNNDGAYAPYLSPYSKVEAGWLQPINISKPGYYTLQPAELSSQIYVIQANFPVGEYLYIENRYGLYWDQQFAGKGIVIYHIDEAVPMQTERGYPGHPNWPAWHYRVALQQADGQYDIEKGVNLGDAGDFYNQGSVLGPGPSTWPNTDSYQNGQVATGITISITTAASFIMQIHVTW